MRTKFVNGTSSEITLKEANSGIQRYLGKLQKKGHGAKSCFEMELDTNATYREYHLFVIPSSHAGKLVVSSDHLVDNKVITITEVAVQPGVYSWEGTLRKEPTKIKPVQEEEAHSSEDQAASTKSLKWWLPKWRSP